MCLLISHPADTSFDEEDIIDFYKKNDDGVGVMWAAYNEETKQDVLYTRKLIPADEKDAVKFYDEHCRGKDCVIHFRMQTHGKIDLINCHPYFVNNTGHPIALMHNGVLSTGNKADVTKSDTWHYINDYLRPLLSEFPTLMQKAEFIAMLEEHIGSGNKFIMLDAYGNKAIVNEDAFVEYKGALLSNTYAWTSSKGGFKDYSYKSTGAAWNRWYDDDGYYNGYSSGNHGSAASGSASSPATAGSPKDTTQPVGSEAARRNGVIGTMWEEDQWCAELFEALKDLDEDLYELVQYADACDLYNEMGRQFAYEWLDEIMLGCYTIEQVLSDIIDFSYIDVSRENKTLEKLYDRLDMEAIMARSDERLAAIAAEEAEDEKLTYLEDDEDEQIVNLDAGNDFDDDTPPLNEEAA